MKLARLFSVRKVLSYLLVLSVVYAAYSIYYKIKYWGFSLTPKTVTDVWRIDAKVTFMPISKNIHVVLSVPSGSENFKILSEEIIANGYDTSKDEKDSRVIFEGKKKHGKQSLYYRLNIYEDVQNTQINL